MLRGIGIKAVTDRRYRQPVFLCRASLITAGSQALADVGRIIPAYFKVDDIVAPAQLMHRLRAVIIAAVCS